MLSRVSNERVCIDIEKEGGKGKGRREKKLLDLLLVLSDVVVAFF